MSKVLINDTTLTNIGDAIRAKTGETDKMLPSAMAGLISGISTGFDLPFTVADSGSFTLTSDWTLITHTAQSSTSTENPYNISHNLGVVPKLFVLWLDDSAQGTYRSNYITYGVAGRVICNNSQSFGYYSQLLYTESVWVKYSANPLYANYTADTIYLTDSQISVGNCADSYSYSAYTLKLLANFTYHWIALA